VRAGPLWPTLPNACRNAWCYILSVAIQHIRHNQTQAHRKLCMSAPSAHVAGSCQTGEKGEASRARTWKGLAPLEARAMGLNSHSSSVGSFHSYGSLQDTCQQRCSQRQPTSRHAYSYRCRDSYKNMFPPALILAHTVSGMQAGRTLQTIYLQTAPIAPNNQAYSV